MRGRPRFSGFRFPAWYLALLGLVGLQRLRELVISSRNSRSTDGSPSAAASYPLIVAAHVGLLTLPGLEIALQRGRSRPRWGWIALLLGATGLRWWSIRTLGKTWNIRAQVPADFHPVSGGPYRYIRHPNYLALIIEFAALPMAGGAWISALGLSALNGVALHDRIRAEEAQLLRSAAYREAFKDSYRLIPGVY